MSGAGAEAHDEIRRQLQDLAELATAAMRFAPEISALAETVTAALVAGHKLMFCGNGGSAADAQHLATEYVVRFRRNRRPFAALALTTDSSLLTAASNDFGYERIFELQVRALGRPGDVLFLHSTSGSSPNLLAAARAAREIGVTAVGILARGGGPLKDAVDVAVVLPTDTSARAQELHLAIGHIVCELVETRLAAEAEPAH